MLGSLKRTAVDGRAKVLLVANGEVVTRADRVSNAGNGNERKELREAHLHGWVLGSRLWILVRA